MENNHEKWMVYIRCWTYNHSPYIIETLNGFTMQQTNFPFACIIVDDHSTDGEADIIKKYVASYFDLSNTGGALHEETDDFFRIFAQHKVNKNCFFAVYFLKYNHYSVKKPKMPYLEEWKKIKYWALCEGDDYWCSPYKLQRQVDFLESHPDHSLCFHANYSLYNDGTKKIHRPYTNDAFDCPIQDLILCGGGFMATNSMLFISALGNDYRVWAKSSRVGDGPLMLTLAARGKVGYINEVMSCYRVATEGSWTQRVLMDKKKNKEHYKRTLDSWHEYDEWTGYKYHKYIKQKIRKNKLHFWIKNNAVLNKIFVLIYKKR